MIGWLRKILGGGESTPSIDDVDFEALAQIIGCPVQNENLFTQALRHRSLLRGTPDAHKDSNERLEYLGDAILGFVVAEHLYRAYPDRDEGFLTRLRAKLVNGRALAERARAMNLGQFIQVSNSLSVEQKDSDSILADAFEAIIGAIYLEHGIEVSRSFIERTGLHTIDLDQLASRKDNHKSILVEFVQAGQKQQPVYSVVSESGPSHDKRFIVAVLVDDVEYGRGEARSKKRAEQHAAKQAFETLKSKNLSEGFKQS